MQMKLQLWFSTSDVEVPPTFSVSFDDALIVIPPVVYDTDIPEDSWLDVDEPKSIRAHRKR